MAFQEPISDQPNVHGTKPTLLCLLHHSVVDRDRRHLRETVLVDLKAGPVPGVRLPGTFEGSLRASQHVGAVGFHGLNHGSCRKAKHARVPVEPAAGDIVCRRPGVGLFDKTEDLVAFRLNVSEGSLGSFGLDAEGDDPPLCSKRGGCLDCVAKSGSVRDEMVCRQNQKDGVGALRLSHVERSPLRSPRRYRGQTARG